MEGKGLRVRKNAVEGKGLRVNVDKTKGMQLLFGKKSSVSKVDPCGVCEWVVYNMSELGSLLLF